MVVRADVQGQNSETGRIRFRGARFETPNSRFRAFPEKLQSHGLGIQGLSGLNCAMPPIRVEGALKEALLRRVLRRRLARVSIGTGVLRRVLRRVGC